MPVPAPQDVPRGVTFDETWEAIHRTVKWGTEVDPRMAAFVWKEFSWNKERSSVRILDLGTGVGAQAAHLAINGYHVEAIDASPSAIARAKDLFGHMPNLHFHRVDATRLGCASGIFDAVIDVCCLQSMTSESAALALREAQRVLKPGGLLFSMTEAAGPKHDRQDIASLSTMVRTMAEAQVHALYGAAFDITYRWERHFDGAHQEVPLWIVEGKRRMAAQELVA